MKNGQTSYYQGVAAENSVADAYRRNGFDIVAERWKQKEGEIDLIAQHGAKYYFIEVKSSRTFDKAAQKISERQQERIQNAALQFLAQKAGTIDVDCRFDAALVDGVGRVKVITNVFCS